MPLFVKFKGRTVFHLAHPLFCWVKKEILRRLEFTNAIWCHKFIYRPINFSAGYEKIELCEPLKSLSIVTNQVLTKSLLMAHKQITIGSKPFWSSLIFFVLFLISQDILLTLLSKGVSDLKMCTFGFLKEVLKIWIFIFPPAEKPV